MDDESPLVGIDEVMNETDLTRRQIRFDIKYGYLPGSISHRGQLAIWRDRPNSSNAFLQGEWLPAEQGSHKLENQQEQKTISLGWASIDAVPAQIDLKVGIRNLT